MANNPATPLISVILAAYQAEDIILRAVQSVLKQTYTNLELIVVDDGSKDNTINVLKTVLDPRLKVLSQSNQGTAVARNTGFMLAQGDYLAFIDADDIWFPDKLQVELQTALTADDPVCTVYSWYYAVDEAERLVNLSPAFRVSGMAFETVLTTESMMLPSTTLMHRQVFEKTGGFPAGVYHEDRAFFIKAAQQFPIIPSQQRLVIYRQSMSGKCRGILTQFDKALEAEMAIVHALQADLSTDHHQLLEAMQTRALFYRFLMYNFPASAKRLYQKLDPKSLLKDKKGILSFLSLLTGINFLCSTRITVQFMTKHMMLPWWRWKSTPIYQLVKG